MVHWSRHIQENERGAPRRLRQSDDIPMQKKRYLIRSAAFIAIFAILLPAFAWVFSFDPDQRIYQWIGGFYEEPEDSLSAVYIGASTCYAFWNPLVAYHNYGLAVYPYTSTALPFYATEHLIKEARKTQPDATFIVNINSVEADDLSTTAMHHLLNYMPDSQNKTDLTNYLADLLELTPAERLEFRYPFLKIRVAPISVMQNIVDYGLPPELDGLKGASHYDTYLNTCTDIADAYIRSDERSALPEALVNCIESLLDYCEAENVNILFVAVPRAEDSEEALQRINTAIDLIRARDFPLLDLTDEAAALGMDLTQDYYNGGHTNIHGSIKFTNFLSEYLIETFDLQDLRGSAAHASWDAGWEAYAADISPIVLDLELDAGHRDYALHAPAEIRARADGDLTIQLEWTAVDGADGYKVFRKDGSAGSWQEISACSETRWLDSGLAQGVAYSYTVVPFRTEAGEAFYGNFDYKGVACRPQAS